MRSCSELSKIQRFSWLIKEFKGTACQNRRRLRTKADSPGQQGRASLDDAMSQNLRELIKQVPREESSNSDPRSSKNLRAVERGAATCIHPHSRKPCAVSGS